MKKFENYASNLRVLEKANQEVLDNTFIISGIINKFAIQFELGWKVLKKLLSYEGSAASSIGSPRSIIKEAYAIYPFFDGELWLDMLNDRNSMAHIYDGNAAQSLVQRILKEYIPEFAKLEKALIRHYGATLDTL